MVRFSTRTVPNNSVDQNISREPKYPPVEGSVTKVIQNVQCHQGQNPAWSVQRACWDGNHVDSIGGSRLCSRRYTREISSWYRHCNILYTLCDRIDILSHSDSFWKFGFKNRASARNGCKIGIAPPSGSISMIPKTLLVTPNRLVKVVYYAANSLKEGPLNQLFWAILALHRSFNPLRIDKTHAPPPHAVR